MTETVERDDQPRPQPTSPITRKGGVEYLGGTEWSVGHILALLENGWSASRIASHAGLPIEAVEFVQRREQKRARKKDPVRRKLKANGRACRNRGRDFEKHIEARLAPFGFKRVPGSGMFGGNLSGDLRRERQERVKVCERCREGVDVVEPAMLIECKRQAAEQRFFRNALAQGGGSDAVVVGKKGIEPLVVMLLKDYERLLDRSDLRIVDAPHTHGEPK